MPPRSRPRRSAAAVEDTIQVATPSRRGRSSRKIKEEDEEDSPDVEDGTDADLTVEAPAEEEGDEDESIPEAGPSRRGGRGRGRGKARGRGRGAKRGGLDVDADEDAHTDAEENDEEGADNNTDTPRRRARKSVSYRELPPADDGEEDAEGEDDVELEAEADAAEEAESPEVKRRGRAPKPVFEKVGSGRGGFSVKGAAAAAARARWDKVRRERAERGEESDDDKPKRRATGGGASNSTRNKKPSDDTPATGSTVFIKGKEYVMGEDELILPDNEKGDAKIDAEGHLQGGREFKMYTYTSESRPNPNRVYALTIDVARACGYTDSLAFLRRVPQIVKLSCHPSERDMLIEKGRVTGNLKHRMVTMVAVRNIYKLLGAKVVKDGKWVTDDYDEETALAKCQEFGITPGSTVHDDEVQPHSAAAPQLSGRGDAAARAANLVPFYSVGGPTTHFGGNGATPVYDAGWGSKRAKLRAMGVTEEDWMLRTAEETRRIDQQLKDYRSDRLVPLEGSDARPWVYAVENRTESIEDDPIGGKKSEMVHAPTEQKADVTALTPAVKEDQGGSISLPTNGHTDVEMTLSTEGGIEGTESGKVVVETAEDRERNASKYNWGLGSWRPGVVRAVYEPHTQMPHVPLHTQPQSAVRERLSHYPLLASYSDSKHKNFVQSSVTGPAARGLASVEYVFETRSHPPRQPADGPWEVYEWTPSVEKRLQDVAEAEEWERQARKKQKMALPTTAATGGVHTPAA